MKDLIQPSTPIDGQRQVAQVQAVAETWSPQHVLTFAFQTFGKNVAISSAFGAEGIPCRLRRSRSEARWRA